MNTMKAHPLRSAAALLVCLALLCCLGMPALAAVPERPDNYYVLDEADVLQETTEADIIRRDEALFQSTGAEIVVVAVDFLGGEAIDDYSYELFEDWGIGSSQRQNGLLLVLAVGEEDYYAMPGTGIEDAFSGSTLQTMLDDYLEPDFAQGNYDAGVRKFFDAAYQTMEAISYDDSPSAVSQAESAGTLDPQAPTAAPQSQDYTHETKGGSFLGSLLKVLLWIILILIVLFLAAAVLRALSRNRRVSDGGGFWTGMFLGSRMGGRTARRAPPPPREPRQTRTPPREPYRGSSYRDLGAYGQSRPSAPRSPAPRTGGYPRPGSGTRSTGSFGSYGSSRFSGAGRSSGSGGGSSRNSSPSRSAPSRGGDSFTRGGGTRGGGAGRR